MISLRTCLGCGQQLPKGQMLRIVCQDGGLKADYACRLPGRGTYFCGKEDCARRIGQGKFKAKPPLRHGSAADWRQLMADIKNDE